MMVIMRYEDRDIVLLHLWALCAVHFSDGFSKNVCMDGCVG